MHFVTVLRVTALTSAVGLFACGGDDSDETPTRCDENRVGRIAATACNDCIDERGSAAACTTECQACFGTAGGGSGAAGEY